MRALRGATLVLTALLLAPAPGLAQAPSAARGELIDAGVADPIAWWSRPGLPGWTPGGEFGATFPPTLVGLVRGSWRLTDSDRAIGLQPFPGVLEATVPLAWLDTLAIETAESGARDGFDAGLANARARTMSPPPKSGRQANARADALLGGGSDGYQDNALSIRTGDPSSYLWGEAESSNRDEHATLGLAGHHAYDGVAARTFGGRHRVTGSFAQRGAAASMLAGVDESASGESGALEYRWLPNDHQLAVRLSRGQDHRESFGGGLPFSRRDAQQTEAEVEFSRRDSVERWGISARASEAEVRRATVGVTEGGNAGAWWVDARLREPAGDGVWNAGLGVGRHEGVERFEWAPSLSYRFGARPIGGRAVIERQVVPVWSDLAPGQSRFLQSTWLGGLEVEGRTSQAGGHLGFYAGRARDRAVVARFPLTDLWLRSGFRADPGDYDFALVSGSGQWTIAGTTLGASGFALTRDAGSLQPRVDPSQGFRAFAEWGFLAFQRDLSIRLRGEAAGIGTREVQSGPAAVLPGYVTYGASVVLVLSDVRITLRAMNLEDRRREEVWRDFTTGEPALGPGREFQTAFTWRLFN